MLLNHKEYGNGEPAIFILHGIFGMLDNWHFVAGKLAEKGFKVITSDARNHGNSPHTSDMSYDLMAQDLANLIKHSGVSEAIVMGHSMGGKTAMRFAQIYPELTKALILVDIAPKDYPAGHTNYFKAFESIDFSEITSRKHADEEFMKYESNEGVRQFLLKNITPTDSGYKLKLNIPVIKEAYEEIIGPFEIHRSYEGPVLVVKGDNSGYIKLEDAEKFYSIYPNCEIEIINNAGHWVHADNPADFIKSIANFIKKV